MTNHDHEEQTRTGLARDSAGEHEERAQRRLDERLDSSDEIALGAAQLEDAGSGEWVRLHRLLRTPDVAVPAGFADDVMARVRESSRAAGRSRRWSIGVAVAGFVALAVLALVARPEATGDTVLGTLATALVSAAVAGAGLLTATWAGVGETVGSWLGTSPTTGAVLVTVCVASLVTLGLLLRRGGTATSSARRD